MTTTITQNAVPSTARPRTPALHRAVGWAAAAGTLPYLTLKTLWLARVDAGLADPAMLTDPTMIGANAVTAAMDALVIALALALTHRWGYRLPAWSLLLPVWVGTGFLVPIAVVNLPVTVFSLGFTGPLGDGSLAPWVGPMVYGGFAWQGTFLVAAFVLHARTRWSAALTAPPSGSADPLLRVLAAGGAAMAVVTAGLHLTVALTADAAIAVLAPATTGVFALAGAAGVFALVRGTSRPALAVAAAWSGSAAMFSWGLFNTVLTVGVDTFGREPGLAALAQLSGLLGGFALAVAGLLALRESRGVAVADSHPEVQSSGPKRSLPTLPAR